MSVEKNRKLITKNIPIIRSWLGLKNPIFVENPNLVKKSGWMEILVCYLSLMTARKKSYNTFWQARKKSYNTLRISKNLSSKYHNSIYIHQNLIKIPS